MRKTKNVIGFYEGTEYPDRYVIFGNHRDAWVFGAMDPNSGTTIMLEVIKAFGELYKEGWRPKRSLMFASWGSEEYGLIGSQVMLAFSEFLSFQNIWHFCIAVFDSSKCMGNL